GAKDSRPRYVWTAALGSQCYFRRGHPRCSAKTIKRSKNSSPLSESWSPSLTVRAPRAIPAPFQRKSCDTSHGGHAGPRGHGGLAMAWRLSAPRYYGGRKGASECRKSSLLV